MSKAEQVYSVVLSRIREGTYRAKLPNELELAEELAVNAKTVAKALRVLSEEGVVERKRHMGTFVMSPHHRPPRPALSFLALRDNIFAESNPYRHRVLAFLERLWEEGSKRNIPLHLLPHTAHLSDLQQYCVPGHAGSYAVLFGGRGAVGALRALLEMDFKPVLIGLDREHYPELRALPFLAIDGRVESAYRDLVTHMKVRGRRRIGALCLSGGKDKLKLFRAALDEQGLEFDPRRTAATPRRDDHTPLLELLARETPLDGLILPDNESARVAADELRRTERRVPHDVAIACVCGDLDGPSYPRHRFTHMEQDHASMAREVAAVAAGNCYEPGTRYFHARLVQGDTT